MLSVNKRIQGNLIPLNVSTTLMYEKVLRSLSEVKHLKGVGTIINYLMIFQEKNSI